MKKYILLAFSVILASTPQDELKATIDTGICADTGKSAPFNWSASLPGRLEREEISGGDVQNRMRLRIFPYDETQNYVALSRMTLRGTTPTLRESEISCRGREIPTDPTYRGQGQGSVTYVECDEDCSSISKADLIDSAYLNPAPRTFVISGRWSFDLTWEDDDSGESLHDFAFDDDDFQFSDLLEPRAGDDGISFHPEIFRFHGQVRHLKDDYPNQRKRITLPLITEVEGVEICPYGNTAAQCAPEEAAEREFRTKAAKMAKAEEEATPNAWLLAAASIIPAALLLLFLRRRKRPEG